MPYALVRSAKEWLVSALGTNDDAALIEAMNVIRREWYGWYQGMSFAVDAEECFEVQSFALDCNRCQDCYRGVTLPRDFAAVEAMWFDDRPVKLYDRWRQWHNGITPYCECGLSKDDIGDDFPTERDIVCGQATRLRVLALDSRDIGAPLLIRGQSIDGDREQSFILSDVPQMTDLPFCSLARRGGISKAVTKGVVIIAEESGRILSRLAPDETVPSYKRIRINGLPAGQQFVNIRAARQYVQLFDDMDVVETDNQPAWESMGRYLRINRKQDRTRDDIASENNYLGKARELLLGDKSRNLGKSTRGELKIATPRIGMHALNRTRSRRW